MYLVSGVDNTGTTNKAKLPVIMINNRHITKLVQKQRQNSHPKSLDMNLQLLSIIKSLNPILPIS